MEQYTQKKSRTSKEYFIILILIYFSIIISQILVGGILYFSLTNYNIQTSNDENLEKIFIVLSILFMIGIFFGSNIFFKKRLAPLKDEKDFSKKLAKYFAENIIRYALMESPSYLALVSYFIFGNSLFLVLAGFNILTFFTIYPTKEKIVSDLNFSESEKEKFNNPNTIIIFDTNSEENTL